MDITIYPKKLHGTVNAVPSKSQAHRILICAAFADKPTTIICAQTNDDIEATVQCLCALGADIQRTASGYHIIPTIQPPRRATLFCRESGSTFRFLLPVAGALGIDCTFVLEGRLAGRPISPLWEVMEHHGCKLEWQNGTTLHCSGKLRCGSYPIAGNVSSQFISGLMMAFPLIDGDCVLHITGTVQSKPYIDMTKQVHSLFAADSASGCAYRSPGTVTVEGDWSSAAFFLGANTLGSCVQITGLDINSAQGDKAIISVIAQLETNSTVDVSNIPDLVPILSVIAAGKQGVTFTNIERLRMKESDRVAAICAMLTSLGISVESTNHTLRLYPGTITGGHVDSFKDHRIAMAAAIAATAACDPVTIHGADCVTKSYPRFWQDYQALGGQYEFHLR